MKQKIILLVSVITLFVSCNSNKTKANDVNSIEVTGVRLDGIKLWHANLETKEGISRAAVASMERELRAVVAGAVARSQTPRGGRFHGREGDVEKTARQERCWHGGGE